MREEEPDAEETDANSEREITVVRHMDVDAPITDEVMKYAKEQHEERGGILEDYILECVQLSISVENAPEYESTNIQT